MFQRLKAWYQRSTAKPVEINGLSFPVLFLPAPHLFQNGIELVNDDKTPMLFVVQALKDHAGISEGDASVAMAMCHSLGGIVVPMASLQAAEQAVAGISQAARESGYPFLCRCVSAGVNTGDA